MVISYKGSLDTYLAKEIDQVLYKNREKNEDKANYCQSPSGCVLK